MRRRRGRLAWCYPHGPYRSENINSKEETRMSIAKVIEITSSSEKGFKDAVEKGIKRAAKTVGKIQGAWVSEEKVLVEDGEITEWRVTMRVTFVLEEG